MVGVRAPTTAEGKKTSRWTAFTRRPFFSIRGRVSRDAGVGRSDRSTYFSSRQADEALHGQRCGRMKRDSRMFTAGYESILAPCSVTCTQSCFPVGRLFSQWDVPVSQVAVRARGLCRDSDSMRNLRLIGDGCGSEVSMAGVGSRIGCLNGGCQWTGRAHSRGPITRAPYRVHD
jgi:hypothetical protein